MNHRTYDQLNEKPLWDWYSVRIETHGDTKRVFFLSRIHVNKEVELNPSFAAAFTDYEILRDRDLLTNVYNRYGDVYAKV